MARSKSEKQQKPKGPREILAEVVKKKGSARVVADELRNAGVKCSQQSVSAWTKGLWPPRPATQGVLKRLYKIPATWSAT